MIFEIFRILAISAIFGLCYIEILWIFAYIKTKTKTFKAYTPKALVIVPCKGGENNFKKNIQSFFQLNYPFYHLVFVVDSKNDSSYPILCNQTAKKTNAEIIFTKPSKHCSGKIAALLTGLEKHNDEEIFVFADSDITVEKNWLKNIINPLQDEKIGATTGYRWYFPTNLKSLLISAWNMIPMVFMFYPHLSFIWGGSTAIKKKVFQQLQIKLRWKTAFSDDLELTNALKKAGYKIFFQPSCIMKSPPDQNLSHFIQWAARQYTWVRWYSPLFWCISFIGFVGLQIIILFGVLSILLNDYFIVFLVSIVLLLQMIIGLTGIIVLSKIMIYKQDEFSLKIGYFILSPLIFMIVAATIFLSLLKRKISWAGKIYIKPKNKKLSK